MRIALIREESIIIVKEESRNPPKAIRAWRSRRRIQGDERHRLADRFDGNGRVDEIGPVGRGDVSGSIDGLESRRPRNGYDVEAAIAAEIAERRRILRAEDDDRIDLARRRPVARFGRGLR